MHELSVTENILIIASSHAQKAGALKVTDIYIVIGRLSSIVDELDPILLGYDQREYNLLRCQASL